MFLWLNVAGYISNVFLNPILFLTIILLISRYSGYSDSSTDIILGISAFSIPRIYIGGVAQSFYYDKSFDTLRYFYASNYDRFLNYTARGVFHFPNGIIGIVFLFSMSWILFDLDFERLDFFTVLIAILFLSISSLTFALFIGNLTIICRDWIRVFVLTDGVLFVGAGIVIPIEALPSPMDKISYFLPVTNGLQALKSGFSGAEISQVYDSLLGEILIAFAYLAVGFLLFIFIELRERKGYVKF